MPIVRTRAGQSTPVVGGAATLGGEVMRFGKRTALTFGLLAAPAIAQNLPATPSGGPVPDGTAITAAPPNTIAPTPPVAAPEVSFGSNYVDQPAAPPFPAVGPVKRQTFGSLEYLLFKLRGNPTPSLVQSVPDNVTPQTVPFPAGANVDVFGGDGIDLGMMSGVKFTFGHWMDPMGCYGYDFSFTQIFEQSENFEARSNNFPQIGRGYYNTGSNIPTFLYNSIGDGTQRASILVDAPVRFYTGDFNVRKRGVAVLSDRVDLLVGARYLDLRDSVTIDNAVGLYDQNGVQTRGITSSESFSATNQFFGLQCGVVSNWDWRCFHLDLTGKVAVGGTQQHVEIVGTATDQTAGQGVTVLPNQSILLVQTTNAGQYDRGKFAVMTEFTARLGYSITPNVMATVGYDVLSISSVQRSGAAISTNVNPANAPFLIRQQDNNPNALGPAFGFHGTDFWAHGLTLGLMVSY